jgi:uncharacterized protein
MSESFIDRKAQEKLVYLASATIGSTVRGEGGLAADERLRIRENVPVLHQPMGAFVTIYVANELRGCLGEIEPDDPLAEVVVRCARRVPLHDHRFSPVRVGELARLGFKISVLSLPEPLNSTDQIQIGRHGLIVRHKGNSGLLLPEVPLEHGWDVPAFLKHLWIKAGIKDSIPVSAAHLWSFTSQIISSGDFPHLANATAAITL